MLARKFVIAIAALAVPSVATAQGQREGWMVGASAEALTATLESATWLAGVRVTQLRPDRIGFDGGLAFNPSGGGYLFMPDLGVSYALRNSGGVSVFFRGGATSFILEDEGSTQASVGPYVGAGLAVPVAGRFGLRFDVSPRAVFGSGSTGFGVLLSGGIALLPARRS